MTLLNWPPAQPAFPANNNGGLTGGPRFPNNVEDPGPTVSLAQIWGVEIFGRAGAGPDDTLFGYIDASLNDHFPDNGGGAYSTWIAWARWMVYVGRDQQFPNPPVITVEFRTKEEVIAAYGGADPLVQAVSGWDGNPDFPPLDGKTSSGATRDFWDSDPERATTFFRILIRDDLASGGAGARFSGPNYFVETFCHEMGHAAMSFLDATYPGIVASNVCDMLGIPLSSWNDPDIPWGDRGVEMAAEFFKDTVYPNRRYNSRANGVIPADRFEDWTTLMFSLLENPYWATGNIDDARFHEDQFFNNLGASSFVTDGRRTLVPFVNDAVHPNWPVFEGYGNRFVMDWKPFLDPEDRPQLTLHWNWDHLGVDADTSSLWDDVQGLTDPEPGKPVYNFGFFPIVGNPGNNVRAGFLVEFWDLNTNFVTSGTFYGSWRHWLAPDPSASDDDRRAFVPPKAGSVTVDFGAIFNGSGTWDETGATPVTLPGEGFVAFVSFITPGPMPKYTLYPSEATSGTPEGKSLMWPWLEYLGKRPRYTLRGLVYPTPPKIVTSITAVAGPAAILRPQSRLVQATGTTHVLTPQANSQPSPLTVLDGSQSLDEFTGQIILATTLGLPNSGRVSIKDPSGKVIYYDYGGTSDTFLTGCVFYKGTPGSYADGSHVYGVTQSTTS